MLWARERGASRSPSVNQRKSRSIYFVLSNVTQRLSLGIAAGVTGVLLLGACASTPAPTASVRAAHQAISSAERAEAAHYAPVELDETRTKLASADTAVAEQKMTMAAYFAEQSNVEAQLASAKTANLKAKAVNAEMTQRTGTLIEEMQRKSGEKP